MFCSNCGTKNNESSKFCSSCGRPLNVEATVLNDYQANPGAQSNPDLPSYPGVQIHAGVQSPHSNAGKKIGIIAFTAVLVVLIFAAFSIFGGGGSPEKVAEKYLTVLYEDMDLKKALKYSAFNYENLIEQLKNIQGEMYYDYFGNESISGTFNYVREELKDALRDSYGDNYKITMEVHDSVELSEREMKEIIEQIESFFGYYYFDTQSIIATDKIKKMCAINIEMTIAEEYDEEAVWKTIICAKIGRNWYVMDESIIGDYLPF